MFQFSEMQSMGSSLFSAYASVAALLMMIRSIGNDLVPDYVQSYLRSLFQYFITPIPSSITIVVDEQCGMLSNEVYKAAETYLSTKLGPSTERFKVSKTSQQNSLTVGIEKNEEIIDVFQDFHVKWKFVSVEEKGREKKLFELTCNKKLKDRVLEEYLPSVMARVKEIEDATRIIKIYKANDYSEESISLDHPVTFDKLAMDPAMKKAIMDDLDRFVKRKDYYRKVGKAWKRGYLLYGPPGTGKSSLIAAMANYLKFDVYDLELTDLNSNEALRSILVSTSNKSIIVIEDIDCSIQMQDRESSENDNTSHSKLTLSGMLNFMDGLWSSCGNERIIVFTTNHKDRIDPALLRPGRMDVHIHMSYCTYEGFKVLASNYLGADDHHVLFGQIENLIKSINVTPAEVAEEMMKSEDVDVALLGVIELLKRKKIEVDGEKVEESSGEASDHDKM